MQIRSKIQMGANRRRVFSTTVVQKYWRRLPRTSTILVPSLFGVLNAKLPRQKNFRMRMRRSLFRTDASQRFPDRISFREAERPSEHRNRRGHNSGIGVVSARGGRISYGILGLWPSGFLGPRKAAIYIIKHLHEVPGWRNWQTQRTQNPPVLSTLGVRLPLPAPICLATCFTQYRCCFSRLL